MNGNLVITEIKQLTPERLTNIFRNKGFLNQGRVTGIVNKNSLETPTSKVYFLVLKFSNDAQTELLSPQIVVKIPNEGFFPLPVVKILGTHKAKFYSFLADSMKELSIPICYDVKYSEDTGLSHLILEDLSDTHLDGEPSPSSYITPSKRHCERAIDCLAELHAYWWNHHKLKELSKHSNALYTHKKKYFNEERNNIVRQSFEEVSGILIKNEKETLIRFLEFLGDKISDISKDLFKTVFSSYPQVVYDRIKKENLTLIHRDSHLGNFFFPKDLKSQKFIVILYDWQSWGIGVGTQDLVRLSFINLFHPTYRKWMETELVKRYHNNLLKLGIKRYSWDDCWYDYRLFVIKNLYTLIQRWSVKVSSNFWHRLESSLCAIEDLNCMELLE